MTQTLPAVLADRTLLRDVVPSEVAFFACDFHRTIVRDSLRSVVPTWRLDLLLPSARALARFSGFGRAVRTLVRWLQTGEPASWPLLAAFSAYERLRLAAVPDSTVCIVESAAHAKLSLALGYDVHPSELAYLANGTPADVAHLVRGRTSASDCCSKLIPYRRAIAWLRACRVPLIADSPAAAHAAYLAHLQLDAAVPWDQRSNYCDYDDPGELLDG